MPEFNVKIGHRLGSDEALMRMQQLFAGLKSEYADKISDMSENWNAHLCRYSFRIMGFLISGSIRMGASEVEITGGLPFTAMLFKGQIESAISRQVTSLLK